MDAGLQHGAAIHVSGQVQGVGFRPFVYNLAARYNLTGWVCNSPAGVDIEINGPQPCLEEFIACLRAQPPPLARIDGLDVAWQVPSLHPVFEIRHSTNSAAALQPIPPDVATCPDCLAELQNPQDRRFRYPFINCTNCGPRFSIIQSIPYDRPFTTMAQFTMCPRCAAEYADPANRRFHAQPIACPDCGPHIWLQDPDGNLPEESALESARQLISNGLILAIKGLGGFHLACDATNHAAVLRLRTRKSRPAKPLAIMMPDVQTIERHCHLSESEHALLTSPQHPIVVLNRLPASPLPQALAPGQSTLGVMLPYTPLHHLLMEPAVGFPDALVMTSGNRTGEPLIVDNDEALSRLSSIADAFLLHDRPIRHRCDDSVLRVPPGSSPAFIRRSRGYAPDAILLPWSLPPILAVGGELKNTFCLTRGKYAFISQHIGDLKTHETWQSYESGIGDFEHLFQVNPIFIAHDLHPDYLSTRYALRRSEEESIPAIAVQHHHAHIVACMAENHIPEGETVIGVALDGTGYGTDGTIWGGEFLLAGYRQFERLAHIAPFPLAGGDAAVLHPWRIALALLTAAGLSIDEASLAFSNLSPDHISTVQHQLRNGLNAPQSSSIGRLFDGVAAILLGRQHISFEGQAAMELEALADTGELTAYPMPFEEEQIQWIPMIHALVADLRAHIAPQVISARFHNAIASAITHVGLALLRESNATSIALSGGVWQNSFLLQRTLSFLDDKSTPVLIHRQVPANDGGLSLGQAVAAFHMSREITGG